MTPPQPLKHQTIPLTPETIQGFERYLQARGCYTPATIRIKICLTRSLQNIFSATGLPLDEAAAIDRIRDAQGSGRRRRSLNTTVRDLLDFVRAMRELRELDAES